MTLELQTSFADAVPELAVAGTAQPVDSPTILALNTTLAGELGLNPGWLRSPDGMAFLTGHSPQPQTVAMGYAGHQFGQYSPRLGDGRALLLGEVDLGDGDRLDLHVKGTGRTAFSRGGDGNAVVGPMLREYLFAEAMHALGVPTTRALAVVGTGVVVRPPEERGAVLTRVAASHLRVGTFEYAARLPDPTILRRLADHAIARHHPEVADDDHPYLAFLAAVIESQTSLVASWMHLGFVHGVLNTDNVTIAGETIDYGPCAFMDRHDPTTVFSSIDRGGRYAYGNQPAITRWNLSRLGETLIPLVDPDVDTAIEAITEVLETFPDRYRTHWLAGMRPKIGLPEGHTGDALIDDLVEVFTATQVDHTGAFRALAATLRGDDEVWDGLIADRSGLDGWLVRWRAALDDAGLDAATTAASMDAVNPVYVPRNHLVEEALAAASAGNLQPFETLLETVTHPYEVQTGRERYAEPASDEFTASFQTFCGT